MMVRNRAGTRLPTADILATIYLIKQCENSVLQFKLALQLNVSLAKLVSVFWSLSCSPVIKLTLAKANTNKAARREHIATSTNIHY